jgi:hypothetical protein
VMFIDGPMMAAPLQTDSQKVNFPPAALRDATRPEYEKLPS